MQQKKRKAVIILPAFNEAENITPLFEGFLALPEASSLHLVLIDDGSTDNTALNASEYTSRMNLDIVSLAVNKGLPIALRTGFERALKLAGEEDYIVAMDADNTHLPEQVIELISKLDEGYDVVIASRYQRGARIYGLSVFRSALSFLASFLYRILLPFPGVRDYSSGFRAFRVLPLKRTLESEADRIFSLKGFACNTALLLAMRRQPELSVHEIPINLEYRQKRGISKMRVGSTSLESLRLLVNERFYR